MATAISDHLQIEIPDLTNTEAVEEFEASLKEHVEKRGVKTLLKRLHNFQHHSALATKYAAAMKTSVSIVTGVRTNGQRKGGKKKSLRSCAEGYFKALPTPALRQQCELFGLDYDSYEDMDAIIAALVEKNVAMAG